jgi:hypothetical protein
VIVLFLVRFTLCWQTESFVSSSSFGLLPSGNAQVHDCTIWSEYVHQRVASVGLFVALLLCRIHVSITAPFGELVQRIIHCFGWFSHRQWALYGREGCVVCSIVLQ